MNEWNIQSRAHACQACEKPFQDKEPYHTILLDVRGDFLRQDICAGCWEAQFSQGASERKGFVSHWQGTYEAPPTAPPDPIHKETAETLLRKLTELNEPRYAAAAFILAVMLERKRLLKVKEQFQKAGQRIFIYEHPKTGDIFTIPDPDLRLNQLEQVQHDVAHLLEHGLPPSESAPQPPPPAEADAATAPEPSAAPLAEAEVQAAGSEPPPGAPEETARPEAASLAAPPPTGI